MTVETLRWKNGCLEMIDQRVLPMRFEYKQFDSARSTAQGIRDMVVRGAPAIGCAAAYGIALEAQRLRDLPYEQFIPALETAYTTLAASRPTAVNLFWALQRMQGIWQNAKTTSSGELADTLLNEAHKMHREDIQCNLSMGNHGSNLIQDGARVLTHCNAGALATAGYGTALGVIRSAVNAGKRVSVIADETRPFLQGARLTAWEMVQEKIPVTLITDNMAGHLMSRGEIDCVIVGADRVAANGDVANKIGTYTVAILANQHDIPFYVACPLSTIDLKIDSGKDIPIEERAPEEVLGFGEARWAAANVQTRNPAFDVTPAKFVTALITEKGIVTSPNREKIAELFQQTAETLA